MKQRRLLSVYILSLISGGLVFSNSETQAKVTLKNGNFFVGYTDVIYSGGLEPQIQRVYNSKSGYEGIFGKGWGSEYEVKLLVAPDGSVLVKEFGGGAENRFSPVTGNVKIDAEASIKQIIAAAKTNGAFNAAYEKKLRSDMTFRNQEWEHFQELGQVKPKELPPGTQLKSHKFSYQYITKTKEGYLRTSENGKTEKFNPQGKLTEISDKTGNFIRFTYDPKGNLQKLLDSKNRKIIFGFNPTGLMVKLQGENNKEAGYKYNANNELIYSKDVDGNTYTYKYSSDNRHNLIEIGYGDKTTLQVSYYGQDRRENVKSVKERDGMVTEYDYEYGKAGPGHIKVSVKVKDKGGQVLSTGTYEYFPKINPRTGEEFNEKLITVLDGDRTETVYHPDFNAPVLVKHGKDETKFNYDQKGRVLRKENPAEVTEFVYDPKAAKVSKVTRTSKVLKKVTYWASFEYDSSNAQLMSAKNSESKGVKLIYDRGGRIASMIDQSKRRIDFKYNENSRPIEITDPKLGTIKVSYNNSGEIKNVESTAGRKVALEVTSAFQNLLDIIRPAGVTWGEN